MKVSILRVFRSKIEAICFYYFENQTLYNHITNHFSEVEMSVETGIKMLKPAPLQVLLV